MPVTAEYILSRIPEREKRWKRLIGYHRVPGKRYGSLYVAQYRFRAEIPEAKGLRIAFFSDVHAMNNAETRRYLADAAAVFREFQPDYLLCGGDYLGYMSDAAESWRELQKFSELPGVKLAVRGNWECRKKWIPLSYWRDEFAKCGFRLLCNEMYRDDRLELYGLDDPASGVVIPPAWSNPPKQRWMLCHNPDGFFAIDDGKKKSRLAPVNCCGHTHAGQVRLPFLGPLGQASAYGRNFDCGLFRHEPGGEIMVISAGISHLSFPIRLFCRREILLMELE